MSSKKQKKHSNSALPEFAEAMRLIGRSSATQKHDSRPNRTRTRTNSKRAAIKDSRS